MEKNCEVGNNLGNLIATQVPGQTTITKVFGPVYQNSGFLVFGLAERKNMSTAKVYRIGDWVIYRKSKMGPNPGPRAFRVHASPKGEDYSYVVNKFWVVDQVLGDGTLMIRTRRGKTHQLRANDPSLRHANWFDRWIWRSRFVELESLANGGFQASA